MPVAGDVADRARTGASLARANRRDRSRGRSDALRTARQLVWVHREKLAIGLVLMFTSHVAALVLPASSKWLIDEVVGKHRSELLGPIISIAALAVFIQAAASFALSQVLGMAANTSIADMRKRVQAHVLQLPIRYFDSTQTGALTSRIMTDADGLRNLIGPGFVQLLGGVLLIVTGLGVLLWLNWRLTAATLVVLVASGAGLKYLFQSARPLMRERGKLTADLMGRLTEALGGIRVVKSYTAERREAEVFSAGVDRLLKNIETGLTRFSLASSGGLAIVGVIGLLIMWLGGRAIVAGEMTVGDLVMYIFFVGLVASPLISIASVGTQISEAFAGLDRIREVLDLPTEAGTHAGADAVPRLTGAVRFEGVSFEYVAGQPVLHEVSFEAAPGTTTALVGPSGAGKTTVLSLVMALDRPTNGRVMVDGRDVTTLGLHGYRQQLAAVLQESFLFDGTIAENVKYARPSATLAEIKTACQIAHCDEFIARFPDGYDTIVGERGVKLSGGQRQRVSIARAILVDPRILILDEATSSLDTESEQFIQEGLRSLRSGRTTFVIAHRLSTVRSADQILVLDGGEIVERGTHEELLRLRGRYRQLCDRQFALSDQPYEPVTAAAFSPETAQAGAASAR